MQNLVKYFKIYSSNLMNLRGRETSRGKIPITEVQAHNWASCKIHHEAGEDLKRTAPIKIRTLLSYQGLIKSALDYVRQVFGSSK